MIKDKCKMINEGCQLSRELSDICEEIISDEAA